MKFVTVFIEKGQFVGLVDESEMYVWNIQAIERARTVKPRILATLLECIQMGDEFIQKVKENVEWAEQNEEKEKFLFPITDVTLLAPIPRPSKNIFCIGKNYVEHALELGSEADIPEHVMVFTKPPTSVIGQGDWIDLHSEVTDALDYEGELAIVIGQKGKNISKEDAYQYIFGYTILNDITARDLQTKHKQFFIGKSLDRSCPIGPWIVHHSTVQNPNNLHLETKVNGETRQSSSTKHLIFPIDELISVLSQGRTLEPGDIIATGTPKGVGKGFKPPRYLKDGDVIEIAIEEIGTLKNKVKKG